MTVTTSTVDIWQFLLIGEFWDRALGVGAEPKVFPTGLSVSRQLEGRDDVYPRGGGGKHGGSAGV